MNPCAGDSFVGIIINKMNTLHIHKNEVKVIVKTEPTTLSDWFYSLKLEFISLFKFSYLVFVLVILVVSIIEVKHEFKIDLIPGVDTPFDNMYYAQFGSNGIANL